MLLIWQVRARFRTDVRAFEAQYVATRVLLKQQHMIERMAHEGELVDLDVSGPHS